MPGSRPRRAPAPTGRSGRCTRRKDRRFVVWSRTSSGHSPAGAATASSRLLTIAAEAAVMSGRRPHRKGRERHLDPRSFRLPLRLSRLEAATRRPGPSCARSGRPRRSRPPRALRAPDLGRPPLADAVDEFLNHADVRIQADRRLRLLQVVEPFRRLDPLPLVPLAQVEVLEVLQVDHAVAADDLEADLAAGEARGGKFRR